jgi:hypothetical protein
MNWIIKMMDLSFDVIFLEMMLQQTIYTTENTTGTMHHYLSLITISFFPHL